MPKKRPGKSPDLAAIYAQVAAFDLFAGEDFDPATVVPESVVHAIPSRPKVVDWRDKEPVRLTDEIWDTLNSYG